MHYELSTVAYDLECRYMNDMSDQDVFSVFAANRQNTAVKLAKYIEFYASEVESNP